MVTEVRKSYKFDLETIYKPEADKLKRKSLPKFPAMEIDDELFFEDRVTTVEELTGELIRRGVEII